VWAVVYEVGSKQTYHCVDTGVVRNYGCLGIGSLHFNLDRIVIIISQHNHDTKGSILRSMYIISGSAGLLECYASSYPRPFANAAFDCFTS
jgi:hypothetical protein